jgi:Flp pilus assembly protein TadB
MDLWLSLFWTGPIGVGVFLAGLGVLFIGISQLRKK